MILLGACKHSENSGADDSDQSDTLGLTQVDEDLIKQNYRMFGEPTEEVLAAFIFDTFTDKPRYTIEDARALAPRIIAVANAAGIDAFVFAGLVGHESWFQGKSCYAGGCGLTQMTGAGVAEFSDQFEGVKGNSSPAAWDFIHKMIDDHAFLKANFLFIEGTDKLQKARIKAGIKSLPDRSIEFNAIASNPTTSLIYGAVLLKLYLAEAVRLGKSKQVKFSAIYAKALTRYNGNVKEPKIMNCYAHNVAEVVDKLLKYDKRKFNQQWIARLAEGVAGTKCK
jgi:hypothetical protein